MFTRHIFAPIILSFLTFASPAFADLLNLHRNQSVPDTSNQSKIPEGAFDQKEEAQAQQESPSGDIKCESADLQRMNEILKGCDQAYEKSRKDCNPEDFENPPPKEGDEPEGQSCEGLKAAASAPAEGIKNTNDNAKKWNDCRAGNINLNKNRCYAHRRYDENKKDGKPTGAGVKCDPAQMDMFKGAKASCQPMVQVFRDELKKYSADVDAGTKVVGKTADKQLSEIAAQSGDASYGSGGTDSGASQSYAAGTHVDLTSQRTADGKTIVQSPMSASGYAQCGSNGGCQSIANPYASSSPSAPVQSAPEAPTNWTTTVSPTSAPTTSLASAPAASPASSPATSPSSSPSASPSGSAANSTSSSAPSPAPAASASAPAAAAPAMQTAAPQATSGISQPRIAGVTTPVASALPAPLTDRFSNTKDTAALPDKEKFAAADKKNEDKVKAAEVESGEKKEGPMATVSLAPIAHEAGAGSTPSSDGGSGLSFGNSAQSAGAGASSGRKVSSARSSSSSSWGGGRGGGFGSRIRSFASWATGGRVSFGGGSDGVVARTPASADGVDLAQFLPNSQAVSASAEAQNARGLRVGGLNGTLNGEPVGQPGANLFVQAASRYKALEKTLIEAP